MSKITLCLIVKLCELPSLNDLKLLNVYLQYFGLFPIFLLDMKRYSNEFYSALPHNTREAITSKKVIAHKQDICQVNRNGPTDDNTLPFYNVITLVAGILH